MEPIKISPEDPRLTAYALNEMAPEERAGFEQLLAQDATARQAVEEIVATASLLSGALEHEAMQPVESPAPRHDAYAKVIQFPYWKISGLAAACFAVFFIYWQRNEIANEQKQYIEVPLTAAPAPAEPEPAEVAMPAPLAVEAEQAKRDELQSQAVARMAKQTQDSVANEQLLAARNQAIESATKKARVAAAPIPAPMPMPASAEARNAAPAPGPMVAGKSELKEEVIALSSFEVSAPDKTSFGAPGSTLAGTRVQTELKDMATAATSVTGQISADRVSEGDAAGFRQDNGYFPKSNQPLAFGAQATSSYAEVQRYLKQGRRPPAGAVRIEELVNHFSYNYAPPAGNAPFSANLEVAGAPWAPTHRLVRIGLRARAPGDATENGARVEPAGGALVTIAKAVKIQVEFNPAAVQAYRLIGYENRRPAGVDAKRAQMDLGDDGLDHALTALYEVVPVGVELPGTADAGKYERPESPRAGSQSSNPVEMLTVEIRYKEPAGGANRRLEFPLRDRGTIFEKASDDFKFAASVAAFGMVLQDSPLKGAATMGAVAAWARDGLGTDAGGERSEFLGLVGRARDLMQ